MNRRQTGAVYEQKAAEYLKKTGCRILEMNYRCRMGEIDIVARDGNYVVFCEVKYRSGSRAGSPLEAVDFKKQQVIFRCAQFYLAEHHMQDVPCRFDVIAVTPDEITLYRDAFPYCGW